ncbi:MAG: DNA-formamidopyrimidine glycosylase family protein, partial [Thermoanaerobaculia bacterium]
MPEGDTIFRAARTLHRALAGKTVTRFETVLPKLARVDDQEPIAGRRVERVEAAGKNLIITFSGELSLRTHMRMNGSWHIYRPGERWQRRQDDMRIVIATEDFVAVGFNVPIAEFHDPRSLARSDDLRLIGPDLLGTELDVAETTRRMRARPQAEIAQVLLNQRVLAGIGNVYKSETLFIGGVNPFTKVESLTDATLERLVTIGREILQQNVSSGTRERRLGAPGERRSDPAGELLLGHASCSHHVD